jgi:hypothetical protein
MGNQQAADEVLSSLAKFAKKQMETEPKIDYFATSLPNLLLFDDDLRKRNSIESQLLSALASHGLGDEAEGLRGLQQVIAQDPNHPFAAQTLQWLMQFSATVLFQPEGNPAS